MLGLAKRSRAGNQLDNLTLEYEPLANPNREGGNYKIQVGK